MPKPLIVALVEPEHPRYGSLQALVAAIGPVFVEFITASKAHRQKGGESKISGKQKKGGTV